MKHIFIKKPVLVGCISLVLYYAILEVYFVYFISVEYLRYEFFLNIDYGKYIETKIIFIVLLAYSIIISKTNEFIYSIFIFFLVFFLIPGLITYSFSDRPAGPLYATIALQLCIGAISSFKFNLPEIRTPQLSYGTIMLLVGFAVLPVVLTFGMYFNLSNIVLEDVYRTRELFSANSNLGIDYLYNWLVKALIPLCMVFFLVHNRYRYAFVTFLLLFYLYIISGNKIVYITLFVMLFFYFVGRDHLEKTKYFLLVLIISLLVMPVVDYAFNTHSLKGVFVMRMLFLPTQLNYFYFDLFEGHPLYFAESNFFKFFFTYPFERPVGYIISEIYFDASDMNANNGIISDGYMNLGYPGIVLNILMVSLIFLFFKSSNPDPRYLGIFFVMIFLFLSAPLLSMFVTSGLWIVVFLSLTMMKRRKPAI